MKINLKTIIKSKEEIHIYKGKAIKNKNEITYKDQDIITKIIIDDIITIERKKEYTIIIKLKKGIKMQGSYITKYGNMKIETYTKKIIKKEKELKIIYDLFIDDKYVDTFTYYYEYSIDS